MSDYNLLNEEEIDKLQDEIIREHQEEIRYISNQSKSNEQHNIILQPQSIHLQNQQQQSQQQQHFNSQQRQQTQDQNEDDEQDDDILNNMPFNKSTFASAHTLFSKNASEMKFQESIGEQRDQQSQQQQIFSNRNKIDHNNSNNNRNDNSNNNKYKFSKENNRQDTELEYSTFNGQSKSISIQDHNNHHNKENKTNLPFQKSVKKSTLSSDIKGGISEGQFDAIQQMQSNRDDEIQDLKLYISDLEQEISFLKPAANQCEVLWRDIEMMKLKESKLTEYIIELENKIGNQSNNIRNSALDKLENINNELIDKNITIQQQNALITELQNQISRLKDNNDCWKSQIDKEREQNKELRTYREKNEEQREDIDENKKYKDLYLEIYEKNQEEKIESQNKIFQQEQEIQALISQLNRMQSNINYEQQLQSKNNEINELEELLEKKDSQIQDIDQTFQLAKDEISSLHNQIELLKERIDQLENQIYQKDLLIDEIQNLDYEEKMKNYISKEQQFDEMTNNVCLFINCLRKSTYYSQLQSVFHEDFFNVITHHNVEIIDYNQLDTFLQASLKQLESFMNNAIHEIQENESRLQYLYDADLKVNQLNNELEMLKKEREEFQPKQIESYQISEYQKQVELINYQKIDLEVKIKQLEEGMRVLKGELDHIHGKYHNKIEKRRIFFEKMIESLLKSINNKQLNELCEDIIDKIKDIDKRKTTKLSIQKKIQEIEAEIKINLAKQSQKDIEPLKKFKSQKVTELDDVLEKIKISNQKMWCSYEKMKETSLYERRIKEDLIECERDYLKLKIQFEENRKKYENSNNYSNKNYHQLPPSNQSMNKSHNTMSQKSFKPPTNMKTGTQYNQQQQQNGCCSQLENDMIMHILSSDIQSGQQTTARMFRESRSTSQMAQTSKPTQRNTFQPSHQQQQRLLTSDDNLEQQYVSNKTNNNNNKQTLTSRNQQGNICFQDSFNDRMGGCNVQKQRSITGQNDRNNNNYATNYNDENDFNSQNIMIQRDCRQLNNNNNKSSKDIHTHRTTLNNQSNHGEQQQVFSLKDKLERNKKHLSLNSRK